MMERLVLLQCLGSDSRGARTPPSVKLPPGDLLGGGGYRMEFKKIQPTQSAQSGLVCLHGLWRGARN